MKSPNKIYMTPSYGEPDNVLLASFSKSHLDYHREIEYIRKDALLEWLESKVYEHNEDRFDDGFNAALGQVIDKLNSM